MLIAVVCPGCAARMNVPPSAVGKSVRCPKPGCGASIPVRAGGRADPDDAPSPRARAARAPDDGNQPRAGHGNRDDYDRPRHAAKSGGMSTAAVVAMVLGGGVVLVAIGFGVYAYAVRQAEPNHFAIMTVKQPLPVRTKIPPDWVYFQTDRFAAWFPSLPEQRPVPAPTNARRPAPKAVTVYTCGTPNDDRYIALTVGELREDVTAEEQHAILEDFNRSFRAGNPARERTISWSGRAGREYQIEREGVRGEAGMLQVARTVGTNSSVFALIYTQRHGRPQLDELNVLLDNFEIYK